MSLETNVSTVVIFHLSDTDKSLITQCRGNHNRLGFAIQLSTVRFLSTFLLNPTDVPSVVVDYLAKQLGIADKECLSRYSQGETHWDHVTEIKRFYGYHDFSSPQPYFRLVRWLYTRAWVSSERPSVLFDLATARLVEHKVLLPGVTTLARLISRVRDRVETRLWQSLASKVNSVQHRQLDGLLVTREGRYYSDLDRLRRAPTRVSGPALVSALQRLDEIRTLGVSNLSLASIPQSRVDALARHAAAVRAQAIARMPEKRRIATLLAFATEFEKRAIDDALDVFDLLIQGILRDAKNTGQKERIRTLGDLDAAALRLKEACEILFDSAHDSADVRSVIFGHISQEELLEAVATVEALARPRDDNYYPELVRNYLKVRRFLPTLLASVKFFGIQAANPVLGALDFLASIEGQRRPDMSQAPMGIVTPAWKRQVVSSDGVDRRADTLCATEQLHDSLRRRDVFVEKSNRFSDPRAKLLSGKDWVAVRSKICHALGRRIDAREELAALSHELDSAYRRTAENLPTNAAVSVENFDGRDTLTVTGLDKLDEPPSLIADCGSLCP